jgi:alpha-beta hydrolase superfamily lysophospholipase
MTSTTQMVAAPDGTGFLQRSWANPDAEARLLLVHGLYEHSGRWEHVAEFFVERGYEVQMFDLRGHGSTEGARLDVEFFDQFVDDLEWMIDTVDTDDLPLVVYAHSLGGLMSARYAISERRQPVAWVLSAPALGSNTPGLLIAAGRLAAKVAPRARMADKPRAEQLSADPAVGEAYFADPLITFKVTTRFGVSAVDAMKDALSNLDHIHTPVLTIHGTDDTLVPPAASAPLAGVAGVDRKLYAGLRHEMHNESSYVDVLGYAEDWYRKQLSA